MSIIAEMRAEAARHQISTAAIALRTGIPAPSVARKMRETRPMSLEEAQAIAAAIGIPLSRLAERAERTETTDTAA